MRYLLDTNIFLWWLHDDKRLGKEMRKILADRSNLIFVSAVSFWEIIIKRSVGKLPLKPSLESIYKKNEFGILGIEMKHVFEVEKLPNLHKDPFDRMLIAQAKAEGCGLLTTDTKVKDYFD